MHNSSYLPTLPWQQTKDIAVKVAAAVYFGGVYGLILIGLIQLFLMFQ
ncbi:hypothetical protein [Magnetococcus sp. PR-3]